MAKTKPQKPPASNNVLDKLRAYLEKCPSSRIDRTSDRYFRLRKEFASFVSTRSARLDKVGAGRTENALPSPPAKKVASKQPSSPCLGGLPSIFPVEPCASSFDMTELSLRSGRGTSFQDYCKVLVFNHPFRPGFSRNGWYLGQILRYRQEWRPAGFTVGELVQSFSLLPLEKTVIDLSVWEKSRQDIESMEESAEKRELLASSRATDSSQITKSSSEKFNWHVDAKANARWGWGDAHLEAGVAGSSEHQASSMASSVNEQSRSSASALSESRSVKVGLTRESGREQRTTRTIENTNRCHAVTFNVFQLNKVYELVMTYQDSPLCLILPNSRAALADPTMQAMAARLNKGLRDISSIYSIVGHYMQPNVSAANFLAAASLEQDPTKVAAPFGDGVWVLEFTPLDPCAIREGLTYFFGLVWNAPVDLSSADLAMWDDLIAKYMESDATIRAREIEAGETIVETLELLTPGLYVDAMMGKCSACEDFITISRSNEALKDFGLARETQLKNELVEKEIARRQALLDKGVLDPFEPPATTTPIP